jgi:ribonuclease P protein component
MQRVALDDLKRQTEADVIHVGYTATKRLGNAVVRNFAKRRLRALAQVILPGQADPRFAYVFIARTTIITRPFTLLYQDMKYCLKKINKV